MHPIRTETGPEGRNRGEIEGPDAARELEVAAGGATMTTKGCESRSHDGGGAWVIWQMSAETVFVNKNRGTGPAGEKRDTGMVTRVVP